MDPFRTILTETAEGAAEGGAGAPPDPEAAPADATPEASPAWSGPTQEEWQQVQQGLSQLTSYGPVLGQLGQLLEADPNQAAADEEYDPFDKASVDRYIGGRFEQLYNERLGGIEPLLDEHVRERGDAILTDEIARVEAEVGAFATGDVGRKPVRSLAEGLFQIAGGQIQPEMAIRQAAEAIRAIETAAVEAYKKEQADWAASVRNAPAGVGGGGAASEIDDVYTGAGWGAREASRR